MTSPAPVKPTAKSRRPFQPVIATANDLATGVVVFRSVAGDWARDVTGAQVAETEADASTLQLAAERDQTANRVVDLALIPIVREGGVLRPAALREIIRASGPTIDLPGQSG
jgi:hypothetical protein